MRKWKKQLKNWIRKRICHETNGQFKNPWAECQTWGRTVKGKDRMEGQGAGVDQYDGWQQETVRSADISTLIQTAGPGEIGKLQDTPWEETVSAWVTDDKQVQGV